MKRKKTRDEIFRDRVRFWAGNIDVKPKRIQLRQMSRKWASGSTARRLSFSKALLTKNRKFVDYVIVHELLHLQVPNHGKLFKSMMSAYVPGWEKIEKDR